jgi:CubicO group peptidase (beta-lactamase class C family)
VLDFARGALFDPLGIPTRPAFEQFGLPGEPGFDEFTSGYLKAGFAWPVDPTGINNGADTLKLRPQDLATLGLLYLNHGRLGERQIIPASWVKESTAAQVDTIESGDANGYGYMWWVTTVDHDPAYAAVGFGGQMLEVIPNRNLVVVIATEISGEDPDNADPSQPAWGWTLVENAIAAHFT